MATTGEDGVLEFTDLQESGRELPKSVSISPEDTAFILFTSGTSGKSKGVELSHRNIVHNCQQLRAWFRIFNDGQEIVVGCLPFFHVFGLTTALAVAMYYGWGLALVPLPEPRSLLEAVNDSKATFFAALPTMYSGMLNDPALSKYNLRSLKGCFSGGAPLPLDTIRSFQKVTGVQICEGYGLTECSPVTHINPVGGKTKAGSIGIPLPGTEAKVVDLDHHANEILELGVPGELCVRGPQVMKGYLNHPERTAAALKNGWLLTGDVVTVDQDGYFSVVDRKNDLIVTNGQKVFPRHVDEVLFSHPGVFEACTIGIPDPDCGQSVKSFVVLKDGERATESEIIDFCRSRLAPHAVPKYIDFDKELPRSLVGKILRKELRRREAARAFLADSKRKQGITGE